MKRDQFFWGVHAVVASNLLGVADDPVRTITSGVWMTISLILLAISSAQAGGNNGS